MHFELPSIEEEEESIFTFELEKTMNGIDVLPAKVLRALRVFELSIQIFLTIAMNYFLGPAWLTNMRGLCKMRALLITLFDV